MHGIFFYGIHSGNGWEMMPFYFLPGFLTPNIYIFTKLEHRSFLVLNQGVML